MNGIKPLESVEHLQTPATVGKTDDPIGSISSESDMSVSLGDSVLNMSEGTLTKCVEGIVTFLDADLDDLKCGGSGVTNQSAGEKDLPKGDEKPVPMTVALSDGDEKSHENGNENSVSKPIQNMPLQAVSDEKHITVDEKSEKKPAKR